MREGSGGRGGGKERGREGRVRGQQGREGARPLRFERRQRVERPRCLVVLPPPRPPLGLVAVVGQAAPAPSQEGLREEHGHEQKAQGSGHQPQDRPGPPQFLHHQVLRPALGPAFPRSLPPGKPRGGPVEAQDGGSRGQEEDKSHLPPQATSDDRIEHGGGTAVPDVPPKHPGEHHVEHGGDDGQFLKPEKKVCVQGLPLQEGGIRREWVGGRGRGG